MKDWDWDGGLEKTGSFLLDLFQLKQHTIELQDKEPVDDNNLLYSNTDRTNIF